MAMETLDKKSAIKGGEFLVRETHAGEIFTPEEWSEEQKMIAQSCRDFLNTEVLPKLDEMDSMQHPELVPGLLDKAGALGFLGASVPEKYGGFGMDVNTSLLIAEIMGGGHSFAVAIMAHTGIGTLPILYYGTEQQKEKYLPKLCSGEWKASYCLTEPDSGSDANAAKTRAKRTEDGKHYVINGQKMWITNGGFADLLIVFAKIDDDKVLSAFIVERGFGGISMNEEEKKMGIKGSSTRQIFFNDCKVPVENMLGEREQGFKIALNILNIGRIKLGIAALGGAKSALNHAIRYAGERKQFGRTIGSFGAIKHKIGDVASMIYASEAAHYRAGQNIDDTYQSLTRNGMGEAEAKLKAAEQFAIECAILKVHGSETLDYAVDEGVQIFGGMGYSAEGPMDRAYRDARINRIFEGTNEINRLLTVDMILKRAMKGELDLMGPASAVAKELTSIPEFDGSDDDEPFAWEKKVLHNLKKAALMIAGAAVQKFMTALAEQQEILLHLADMLIQCYVAESAILRAEKAHNLHGAETFALHRDMAMITLHGAVESSAHAGREALYAFAEGDELRMMLMGLRRFTKIEPYNTMAARRRVADYFSKRGAFVL
jgi:alkylation response protein AidB-like acyl-CoA dehydrogenase